MWCYSKLYFHQFHQYRSLTLHGKKFLSLGIEYKFLKIIVQTQRKESSYGFKSIITWLQYPTIHYLKQQKLMILNIHCVLHVSWLLPHPKLYNLGKPAQLWCKDQVVCPPTEFVQFLVVCNLITAMDSENLLGHTNKIRCFSGPPLLANFFPFVGGNFLIKIWSPDHMWISHCQLNLSAFFVFLVHTHR